ncbi:hypothetical protein MTR67_027252 [Solanum verrucosum]|uniref:Reverse transcriptase zinc-binding domain-containing protein n=1 Tax=Solanum verrucosum TaxID=315347 RepID=A0AAF0R0E4_SOLVR|nr:hypothetical protein MTR67_027252 [Solanum verrucosum]
MKESIFVLGRQDGSGELSTGFSSNICHVIVSNNSQGLKEEEDSLYWNRNKNGIYTVKSAYLNLSQTIHPIVNCLWKCIWKAKVPTKGASFSWLVAC